MLLKNALILALLVAGATEIDADRHAVRGEGRNKKNQPMSNEKAINGEGRRMGKKSKSKKNSKKGGGGGGNRAGGGGGGAGNRVGGGGSGSKKSGSNRAGMTRFGGAGVPAINPVVWSPGKAVAASLRGSPNIGQNSQAVPVSTTPVITNKSTGTGASVIHVQPVTNTPVTTTTTVKTGWSGVNQGDGTVVVTGQHCKSSNPNKFRCCNNEGSSACKSAGFGDCCDAFRNMCVKRTELNRNALANLSCKP